MFTVKLLDIGATHISAHGNLLSLSLSRQRRNECFYSSHVIFPLLFKLSVRTFPAKGLKKREGIIWITKALIFVHAAQAA